MALLTHESIQLVQETISNPTTRLALEALAISAVGIFGIWSRTSPSVKAPGGQRVDVSWGEKELQKFHNKNEFMQPIKGNEAHGHAWVDKNIQNKIVNIGMRENIAGLNLASNITNREFKERIEKYEKTGDQKHLEGLFEK